jgi:vacuolar-type H+-ATPase subunit H
LLIALDKKLCNLRDVVGQARGEAENLLEQERTNARIEASQFVNQFHHEAQRVVDETQSKAAAEVQSVVNRASNEVELIKAQANAELSRLRVESQQQVSMLEGRMAELVRIHEDLHKKQDEQTAFFDSLIQQIQNQNQVISQMQQAPMRPVASGPSNGTEFHQICTPVGHNPLHSELRVGSEFAQEMIHQKDLGVQPSGSARLGGVMPLGSVVQGDTGSSKGNRPKQHQASKESQKVESAMREIKSLVARLENHVSRSPSARAPSDKGDSSSSSSSSQPGGGGGSPGGSNPEIDGVAQCPVHHPVGRLRTLTRQRNGL